MSRSRPGAWWRANRVGLISLLGLIPALIAVLVVVPAVERAGRIAVVQDAAPGDTVTAAGLAFTLRAADEFTAEEDGLDLPGGTSLVAAVVDVAPVEGSAGTADTCDVRPSEPLEADRRVWSQVYAEGRYGYARGAGFADSCDPRSSESYSMELVFLTPSGVLDGGAVEHELRTGPRLETIRLDLAADG